MSYSASVKRYLRKLQEEYSSSISSSQHTAELSFRTPMDQLFKDLAKDLNPQESIKVILEPRNQGRVGRPDWRIHNEKSLGIYGYIEGKGLSSEPFDTTPYRNQITKYLSLGHKLIISDGIEFVFCISKDQPPTTISLIDKSEMIRSDWGTLDPNPRFEIYMRNFFDNPSPQQCSEEKLIELVAIRTRVLADDILAFANIPAEEAMDEAERQTIELLKGIKALIYNHSDSSLRTATVFAGFTAQVVMFSLLYAHRVFCAESDTPVEKEAKIRDFISKDLAEGEALRPFRDLMIYLRDHADSGMFITQWVDECIKFLSFVKMTEYQLMNPDYHRLFELFLSKYDAKARFDYGAYYTPKSLANFIVALTEHAIANSFGGASIYDDGNTIIDPCCGTGSFLEAVVSHDKKDGSYNLCGFEILPAPYMLANYRMSVLERLLGQRRHSTNILLTNTLSNSLFGVETDEHTIEGREFLRANHLSSLPIKLIIGNPPCSDAMRENTSGDFSIINDLLEDFRPPKEERRGRQNIQKQIGNPFMQFLRWSCKKLMDTPSHSALAMVLPRTFLENESYKYARKYLCDHFSSAWVVVIDADARTGIRSDSLFNTLQGRSVMILTKEYGRNTPLSSYHFVDCSKMTKHEKEQFLTKDIEGIVSEFSEYAIKNDMYKFFPTKPFDEGAYQTFWPVSDEGNRRAVFINHCSGIKLAPTAMFTHVKGAMLKRRTRDIALGGVEAGKPWFSAQDKPPKDDKVAAFHAALNETGSQQSIETLLSRNIKPYSFRPYLQSNVLLWTDLLKKYAGIGGGGTRLRPEIIAAYSNPNTIGFAMAHAPKDLNPTLSQCVSFCWYYPDNDMCTRGNSHIYMNQYPAGNDGSMSINVNPELLERVSKMIHFDLTETAREIVFYTYAILCSQLFLDEFEGALFTVNQTDKRARVPFVNDPAVFIELANLGRELAELERIGHRVENVLELDYEGLIAQVPQGFRLENSARPFDEINEKLILSGNGVSIEVPCPIELQQLNISGYGVVKSVWQKFNSYNFTHCEFTPSDMRSLLEFLNTIAMHTRIVARIDDAVRSVLNGKVGIITYINDSQ